MACLTSSTRTALIERRATYQSLLDKAYIAYEAALTPNESYEFDDGAAGRQKAKRRKISELSSEISKLESAIDRIDRRLNGGGIVNIMVRR